MLDYNLMIKGSQYAKYFFLLRTLYDKKYPKAKPTSAFIPALDSAIQKKSLKAGDVLKGRHQLDRTL